MLFTTQRESILNSRLARTAPYVLYIRYIFVSILCVYNIYAGELRTACVYRNYTERQVHGISVVCRLFYIRLICHRDPIFGLCIYKPMLSGMRLHALYNFETRVYSF